MSRLTCINCGKYLGSKNFVGDNALCWKCVQKDIERVDKLNTKISILKVENVSLRKKIKKIEKILKD